MFKQLTRRFESNDTATVNYKKCVEQGYGYYMANEGASPSQLYPHYDYVAPFEEIDGVETRIVKFHLPAIKCPNCESTSTFIVEFYNTELDEETTRGVWSSKEILQDTRICMSDLERIDCANCMEKVPQTYINLPQSRVE